MNKHLLIIMLLFVPALISGLPDQICYPLNNGTLCLNSTHINNFNLETAFDASKYYNTTLIDASQLVQNNSIATKSSITYCNGTQVLQNVTATGGQCIDTIVGVDQNNYTSSIGITSNGTGYQIDLARVGLSNLTVSFTDYNTGNCSSDGSCSLITYDSDTVAWFMNGAEALVRNGSVALTAHWTAGAYNISADTFIGRINASNVTNPPWLTTIDFDASQLVQNTTLSNYMINSSVWSYVSNRMLNSTVIELVGTRMLNATVESLVSGRVPNATLSEVQANISSLGNWSADKGSYYNTTDIDASQLVQNLTLSNYMINSSVWSYVSNRMLNTTVETLVSGRIPNATGYTWDNVPGDDLLKNGSVGLSANWNAGAYNITADSFIGSVNASKITNPIWVTTINFDASQLAQNNSYRLNTNSSFPINISVTENVTSVKCIVFSNGAKLGVC